MTTQIIPVRDARGIHIGEGNYSFQRQITLVNPSDRDWTKHDYVLWFGSVGMTYLRVWSNSLDDALETAAEWLAEHAPGHIMPHWGEEHQSLVKEACEELGVSFEPDNDNADFYKVTEKAEADLTYTESGFLTSYEWGLTFEDATREQIVEFLGA